jgi:CubicO group peptidase (beta-lactamase class C family)
MHAPEGSPAFRAPELLAAELERLVRKEQRERRLPSIAAAVTRDGAIVWETAVGAADVAARREATTDTQYRLGSITKTFTAAAVMQLRDEGKLDLEDPLDRHVEGAAHAPSIRRLLSHTSGLQRETHDDAWLKQKFASVPELLETLHEAERVLPAGVRFHYSNLAFALLGIVVERVSGTAYTEYVRQRLLDPLGLKRTSFDPDENAAKGYLVKPYVEGVWDEAPVQTGAWVAAGQMWGTVHDLCRWAQFLAEPSESVLAKRTVEEMRTIQTMSDHVRWTSGYGLGLQLMRDGERIMAGHGGSMPGFIANVRISVGDSVGAALLTNESGAEIEPLASKLVATTVEQWPVPPKVWEVEEPPPAEVEPLLGIWFMEGDQIVFRWRDGRLQAKFTDAPDFMPPAVFERESETRWRIVSGWEHGELLRIEDGRMVLSGYPVTRDPGVWV